MEYYAQGIKLTLSDDGEYIEDNSKLGMQYEEIIVREQEPPCELMHSSEYSLDFELNDNCESYNTYQAVFQMQEEAVQEYSALPAHQNAYNSYMSDFNPNSDFPQASWQETIEEVSLEEDEIMSQTSSVKIRSTTINCQKDSKRVIDELNSNNKRKKFGSTRAKKISSSHQNLNDLQKKVSKPKVPKIQIKTIIGGQSKINTVKKPTATQQ